MTKAPTSPMGEDPRPQSPPAPEGLLVVSVDAAYGHADLQNIRLEEPTDDGTVLHLTIEHQWDTDQRDLWFFVREIPTILETLLDLGVRDRGAGHMERASFMLDDRTEFPRALALTRGEAASLRFALARALAKLVSLQLLPYSAAIEEALLVPGEGDLLVPGVDPARGSGLSVSVVCATPHVGTPLFGVELEIPGYDHPPAAMDACFVWLHEHGSPSNRQTSCLVRELPRALEILSHAGSVAAHLLSEGRADDEQVVRVSEVPGLPMLQLRARETLPFLHSFARAIGLARAKGLLSSSPRGAS